MSTAVDSGPGWRRLHRRTVLVTALVTAGVAAGAAVPVTVALSGRLGYAGRHRLGPGGRRPADRLRGRR